jgi:molybdopterin converting factor small subunit
MCRIVFASSIQKHFKITPVAVDAESVAEALSMVFDRFPSLRGYVLDDLGCVRRHVTIFVNGQAIWDRQTLRDRLDGDAEIYIFQALSGG